MSLLLLFAGKKAAGPDPLDVARPLRRRHRRVVEAEDLALVLALTNLD